MNSPYILMCNYTRNPLSSAVHLARPLFGSLGHARGRGTAQQPAPDTRGKGKGKKKNKKQEEADEED